MAYFLVGILKLFQCSLVQLHLFFYVRFCLMQEM